MTGNYLFTVMPNNTPHELIPLVKLVSNFIVSKSVGREKKRFKDTKIIF
jgi:hypothetical protein